MKKLLYGLGLFAVTAISSCEKNEITNSEYIEVPGNAQLKVMFFSTYRGNPLFQIKNNDVRISNTLGGGTNQTPYPGGGLNTGGPTPTADYLDVTPGSNKISIAIPKVGTGTDSVQLASYTGNMDAGQRYSLFFTDTAANTAAVLVSDTLARPDSGYSKYVFVNLMPDLPSADLYIGTTKVASAIPYKGISPSFWIATNTSNTTWAARTAGGTTNLFTYANAGTIANQRTFIITIRGYNSVTATTDPRQRRIGFIITK